MHSRAWWATLSLILVGALAGPARADAAPEPTAFFSEPWFAAVIVAVIVAIGLLLARRRAKRRDRDDIF